MAVTWMKRKDIPVYLLIYERLTENVLQEILNLTRFLNYKMQFKHVYCLSSQMTSQYKRTKPTWLTKENVYNDELREVVNTAVNNVNNNVGSKWNISKLLDSYLLPGNKSHQ